MRTASRPSAPETFWFSALVPAMVSGIVPVKTLPLPDGWKIPVGFALGVPVSPV